MILICYECGPVINSTDGRNIINTITKKKKNWYNVNYFWIVKTDCIVILKEMIIIIKNNKNNVLV